MKLDIPDDLVSPLIDAINCYQDCVEGNRTNVEDAWFLPDDRKDTGGSFVKVAAELQEKLGDPLRAEDVSLTRTNPEVQDMLHRHKMWRKHGVVTDCDHCGEPLGTEDRAELAKDGHRLFVHAEPCGTELIARGWEIA